MSLKKFKLCKPSNVAFKHLQEILPKNGYRIVVLDRLHQVLHVKKNGSFFSKFLIIKIKLVGIGGVTDISFEMYGFSSIFFKLQHKYLSKVANDLENVLLTSQISQMNR